MATVKQEGEVEHQPFKDSEGTWVVWAPVQHGIGYRLRELSKEEIHELHTRRRGVKQKNKNKGRKRKRGRRRHPAASVKAVTVAKTEEKKEAPPDIRPVCISFPDGSEAEIAADGKAYHSPTAYGGSAYVAMSLADLLRRITGDARGYKVESKMLRVPDLRWKIDSGVMAEWASILLSFDTEALCVYGKREQDEPTGDEPMWMAVVPKQEVSAASVDVDDFGPAIALLASRGYRRVGTIHTHPGNGVPHCSGVDEEDLWTGFGGIHYIVGRDGFVTTYYSLDGKHWDISREDDAPWRFTRLILEKRKGVGCDTLFSQTGSVQIGRMVKRKWGSTYTSFDTQYTKRQNALATVLVKPVEKKRIEEVEGEIIWLDGEWWRWIEKGKIFREATRIEVLAAGKIWTGPRDPAEDLFDNPQDSIVEVARNLYRCVLPTPFQLGLRKDIHQNLKGLLVAWNHFEDQMALVKENEYCTGRLKSAMDIIEKAMFRIELDLVGIGGTEV